MAIEPKRFAGPSDFSACPVWRYDDEDDLYHPVLDANDLPSSERLLSIRAKFTAPCGASFDGYVVGVKRVFSIGLFGNGRVFHLNKNLPDLSAKQLLEFVKTQPTAAGLSVQCIFPLSYVTTINNAHFLDFAGSFEI